MIKENNRKTQNVHKVKTQFGKTLGSQAQSFAYFKISRRIFFFLCGFTTTLQYTISLYLGGKILSSVWKLERLKDWFWQGILVLSFFTEY